jgi:hypothetical protein
MAEGAGGPAAPDGPTGPDAPAAEEAEPMREREPAEEPHQHNDQQEAEQPAAEEPADEAADALEPVPSPAKAKKQAKPRKEQASEAADKPAIAPGSRERKKVEHYKPPEAPASKTATTVQEVRWLHCLELPSTNAMSHHFVIVLCDRSAHLLINHNAAYAGRGHKAARHPKRCAACFSKTAEWRRWRRHSNARLVETC